MTELTLKTITELRDGFSAGEFSAREIAEAFNAAVVAGRSLNAYTVETPELALAAAEAADQARAAGDLKPLSGIPLGIKDLFATEGVDSTAGSNILKGFKPTYESTVSGNLKEAGAGMLGKLNMDEFAMGSSNETSAYGPVISPWKRNDGGNAALTPGGSSGGSAAAVAAGLAPGVTGTDTGGSIRQPAAFTGISRHQADLRPLLALGHRRFRFLARPGRTDGANGARLRDHAGGDGRFRSQGRDLAQPAGPAVGSGADQPTFAARRSESRRNIGSTACPPKSTRSGTRASNG